MVSDNKLIGSNHLDKGVLILVLMEDGLWRTTTRTKARTEAVLILVLMEDGLWQPKTSARYAVVLS